MRNRLGSGKPCANGGTELTLIGYFTMSEGLALRFGSDVSGNANIATIGAVSIGNSYGSWDSATRTVVSDATGISVAVCICTGFSCYITTSYTNNYLLVGYGGCVVMAGSTGSCTIVYYNSVNPGTSYGVASTGGCSFTVNSTSITQSASGSYRSGNYTYFAFSPCTVLYF